MIENQLSSSENKTLYKLAGFATLLAMSVNLLDVIFGFGETELVAYGSRSAIEWFGIFQTSCFKGLYFLGIFNIIYMGCMIPVYFGILAAHRRTYLMVSLLATVIFLLALAVYVANNAAIPMSFLASKYVAATSEAHKILLAAAGQSILARGEDFTPGSFIGLFFSGISAVLISYVMLQGGIFGKANAWIGIVGFTFLTIFTFLATFVSAIYFVAYYVFGMIGGLLALIWFILTALKFFKLGQTSKEIGTSA